ncbi:MAG: PAS domain S-box protein [Chitinophagaceae bacterium]
MFHFFTRRNINIGLAIFLVLFLASAGYTYINMTRARQESRNVNSTLQSLRSFEDVMDDMQDMETGQRGYLISGNKVFLEPFHEAAVKLGQDTLAFRKLFTLYPERIARFTTLLSLVKQKAEFTANSVAQLNDKNRDSLFKEVQSGRGREMMEAIRDIVFGFENEDRVVLQHSNQQRQLAATRTAWLFGLSAIILLVTLLSLFWQIKKELKHREENEKQLSYLARLIGQTSDAVFSTDTAIKIRSWNPAAEEMYGYTAAEALGKRVGELLDIRGGKENDQESLASLQQQGYYKSEYIATKKSGENVYILASLSVLRNEDNEIEGYIAVHRDITERKRSEELLAKFNEELNRQVQEKTTEINHSNERFEMITRTTNDAIWEWDLQTGKMWANETHQQLYGVSLADAVPDEKQWEKRIHPDDRQAILQGLKEALASDENVWISEYRFLAGKEYKYIYDRSYIVRDDSGKATRILGSMMDVTESKKAAADLRESEEKYRNMIEQASDGIFILDDEGYCIDANPAACQMLEYSRAEIKGLSSSEILHKEEQSISKLKKDELRSGQTIVVERKLLKKNGELLNAEISYKSLSSGDILAIARDITEKKKAEEALGKSEELRRLIMNSALDAIVCIDIGGSVTVWTVQAEKIFGWKEEEVIGKKLTETIIPFQYRERHEQGIRHYLKTGEGPVLNRVIEITAINKEGHEFPIELSIIPIRQGVSEFFCAFMRDITVRKKTEEQVVREKELSDTAINSLPGIFYMFDKNRKFLRWNKNFETVSGYTPEEIIKIAPAEFFAEEDRELALKKVIETFQKGSAELEANFLTKSGEKIPYFFTGHSVIYGGATCMLGTGINIKQRRIAETVLKESEEKLRHVLTSSADDFYVIDAGYRVILINKKAEQNLLKDWGRAVTIGSHIIELAPAAKRDYLKENFEKAFAGNRVQYEILNSFEEKKSWIHVEYMPVMDEKGLVTGVYVVTKDITEKKLAEEELKQSNNRFELITRTTNDAVWEWDLASGQLWSNETHQQLYGLTIHDPVPAEGMWRDRLHPDDREKMVRMQQDALASDTNVFISEYRFLSGDSEYVNLYDRCYIVRDETGKPARMMGSMMDITERKKAEEAVRISEEQYRALVENAPEALVVMDMEKGNFVTVSESAVKLFKMSKEKLLEIGPVQVSPLYQPDGRLSAEAAMGYLQEAIEGGKPAFEWTHMDSTGREIPCEVRLVRLPSDKQVLIRGSIIDIEERKKIETELSNERNMLRALIDNLPDYIYVKDAAFNYMICNRAFVKLVGARDETETIGKRSEELFGKEIGGINTLEDSRIVETGKEVIDRDEPIVTREGKKLWLLTTKVPLKNTDGKVIGILGISKDITERKMAEEEIVKTNARFQIVSKATSDIVWDRDLLNKTLWWNDNYYSNLGYRKQKEIVSIEEWFSHIHPDEVGKVREKVSKIIDGHGSTWQDAYRYLKSDGTYLHFLDRGFILRDSEGKAYKMIGSMVDMTPVYEAQRKISESEEKYRTLVEQAVDAIALYDARGSILDVNTGSVQLLGYEKDELMKMSLSDILTPEEIKEKPVRYDVLEQGESTVRQRSMQRKDGSIIQTEVRSQQLPDGRFLSVTRDLTERLKAQQQIEKEKELSDSIISSLPGVFYFFDHTGKFLRWNKKFETVTGYTSEEISRMHPLDFFEGDDKQYVSTRIAEVFEKGISDAEAYFVTKSGEKIPYYFTGASIINEGVLCLLGTGIDVSDRKKAELELETSYDAVRKLTEYLQNVREEERTHIAREIHDELGQQLTVLKMDVSWLNKKILNPDEAIRLKMQELLLMLDETVRTVRRISSELRPSLLDDLGLTAALEWQLKEFEKRSGIKTNFEAPENEIRLPNNVKTAFFRIFQESLTNVARHSGAKNLMVSLGVRDNKFVLSIIDDGKGFDKEKMAEKRTLGILGMQERTSMIGGSYKITGIPGKGTTVEVAISLDTVESSSP